MRTADIVTAVALMALGVLVLADAVRLGFGWGTDGPRSGFFPFWLSLMMIASCVVIVAQAVGRGDRRPFVTRQQLGPVLKVLWPAVVFVVVMQFVGLYVAAALYTGFYMRWVGRHSWPAVLAVAIVFPVVTFVVFEQWFLVPLPKGPVEAWLGY